MRTLLLLFLVCPAIAHAQIEIKKISEGREAHFSWTVSQILSEAGHVNLLVTIHNTGAKRLHTDRIDSSSFSITDASGRSLEILSATGFRKVFHRNITVGHIVVGTSPSPEGTYRFELNAKIESRLSMKFVANGLQFLDAQPSSEAEQGGADQPATAPESKPEGNEKPKLETEGRSQ